MIRDSLATAITIFKKRGPIGVVRAFYGYSKRHPYIIYATYRLSPMRVIEILRRSPYYVVGGSDIHYTNHIWRTEPTARNLLKQHRHANTWKGAPRISLVTYVSERSESQLRQTARSIVCQTYPHWQWLIVGQAADMMKQKPFNDPRIKSVQVEAGKNVPAALNQAIHENKTDYVAFIDCGDTLSCHALYSIAIAIKEGPELALIYSDMDFIENGLRTKPFFKPDWSPAMALSTNIADGLMVVQCKTISDAGLLDARFPTAYLWDLLLKTSSQGGSILHIPMVLYHRLASQADPIDPYETQMMLSEHLDRLALTGTNVSFSETDQTNQFPFIKWDISRKKLVSIIIPSRNNTSVLKACLNSIFNLTQYAHYEVIVVDTGSTDPETAQLYEHYEQHDKFKLVRFEAPFNFSAACNMGAAHAAGDLLLFLNNDTEVLHGDWLELMAQWFELASTGVVGPKLLYPDGKIQHAGVIIGTGGIADHIFSGDDEDQMTMLGGTGWFRNFLAVTGACLMISREVFDEVSGFDENFILNFSDIDLCLKVIAAGYQVIYTPHARLRHHESVTHGRVIPRSDFVLASERFRKWLEAGDPYYNPNLAYAKALRFALKKDNFPIQLTRQLLERLPMKDYLVMPDDVL